MQPDQNEELVRQLKSQIKRERAKRRLAEERVAKLEQRLRVYTADDNSPTDDFDYEYLCYTADR